MAHAVAYVLFALRAIKSAMGCPSYWPNTLLASLMFTLFALGVAQFQQRPLARLLLWGPMVVVPLLFTVLLPIARPSGAGVG